MNAPIHGHCSRNGSNERSRTHRIWTGMRARCSAKTAPYAAKNYAAYAGRGISVCERWNCFVAFLEDMGEAPDGLSIDRIDNDKGYYKENCRWATTREQAWNKRQTRFLTHNGRTMPAGVWAKEVGLSPSCLRHRMFRLGMTVSEALTMPRFTRSRPLPSPPAAGG